MKIVELNTKRPSIKVTGTITEADCVTLRNYLEVNHIEDLDLKQAITDTFPWGFLQDFKPLKTLILPDSLKEAPSDFCMDCKNLEKVTFGNELKKIWAYAFAWTNIKELVIPSSVELVRVYAFTGCHKLESVTYDTSKTTIEKDAFQLCNNVKTFNGQKIMDDKER